MQFYSTLPPGKPLMKNKDQYEESVLATPFKVQMYPNKTTTKDPALQTQLSERQVYGWFINSRYNKERGIFELGLCLSEFIICKHLYYNCICT